MVLEMEAPLDRGYTPTQQTEPQRRQSQLVEYEILDSYWVHQHQWIWLSGLVLVVISMFGMAVLPMGLAGHELRTEIISFVSVISVALTFIWWGMLRHMLNALTVVKHRKREIERSLGMRMEFYLAASRARRKRERIREFAQQEAGDDPELRADIADFLRSVTVRQSFVPGEETAWAIIPFLFMGAWIAFWAISVGTSLFGS
ncbi:MAG: hypothetical protein F4X20_01445 [Dehalococcoidia bacterium]|nr:hypothetical protein [Dehalococcoidia bacterium]